ncbi:hypothetical protein HMPREF9552_02909 [Escherichia coli MS 198-1]|nr:hypothetical protein HMPREF9552_02909 [Escherichia coli MS 198-1]
MNFELGIHLKGGLNQDVKKPTLRRFFTLQPELVALAGVRELLSNSSILLASG